MRRISSARLTWAILGVLVLMAAVWAVRAGQARPAPAASPALAATTSVSSSRIPGTVSAAGIALPYPCCPAGNPPGLTVTGQATVHGTGQAARTGAIAKAAADAAGQAKAAASAAGISLGRIINMQVSAANYPYPLPMGAASSGAGAVGGGPGTSGGSTPAVPCADTSPCPGYPPASTSATVTVTWAIP